MPPHRVNLPYHYPTVSDFVYNPLIPIVRILRVIRTPNLTAPHNGDPPYGVNSTDVLFYGLGYDFRHLEPNAFDESTDLLSFWTKGKFAECQAAARRQNKKSPSAQDTSAST